MFTISASFTAVGSGAYIPVKHGETLEYSLSGTFVGTAILQKTVDGGITFENTGISATAAASGKIICSTKDRGVAMYRWKCTAFTSGTLVTSLVNLPGTTKKMLITAGAKVGGTSGFVVAAATDIFRLATLPASQTAATLVVPITGLKVGQIITGFHLVGQVESGGNTVTIDAALRKLTSAAADLTDALVASMTQLAVTEDTILSKSNARKGSITEMVDEDETFYVLITVTNGASTDIDLQGVALEIVDIA